MQIADCLSRNSLPQELSEDELAAVMTCMNVAKIETDREEDSLFIVTWGQVTSKNSRVVEAEAIDRQIFGPTQEDGVEDDDNGFALEDLNRAAAEAVTLEDIKKSHRNRPRSSRSNRKSEPS